MAVAILGSTLQREQAATETASTGKHDNHREHFMQSLTDRIFKRANAMHCNLTHTLPSVVQFQRQTH